MSKDKKTTSDSSSKEGDNTNIEDDGLYVPLEEESNNESEIVDIIDESEIAQLRQDLLDAQELAEKNQEAVLRTSAELENLRRRSERDIENAHKYAMERFVQELVPVIDSLEMGLAAAGEEGADLTKVKEGTELTLKMFSDCAAKFGIESVDPTGDEFNPEFHQAMSMQETADAKPNTVLAVMQKGYLLQGRLIRPAMVIVSKAASSNASNEKKEDKDGESDKVGVTIDQKV